MAEYRETVNEFDPGDFEPGGIHHIDDHKVVFTEAMTPAVELWNPMYPHNVGAEVRAASGFGARAAIFGGDRVAVEGKKGGRLPSEERTRGYDDATILNIDYFYDWFDPGVSPVAVEVSKNSESLTSFIHPEHPLYGVAPEDGSLPKTTLRHRQRLVNVPSRHCLNLGAAVNVILYDRIVKPVVNLRNNIP